MEEANKKWAKRIESQYIPVDMLQNILPPQEPRPYLGEGVLHADSHFGNEWLINNYLLYNYGIALFGPEFKTLIKPISIKEVQKASIRDLFKEWVPKINDRDFFNNSHYSSYLVLNLCRILYTVVCAKVGSKIVSVSWVKKEFPEWTHLIQKAEDWKHSDKVDLREDTIKFIQFVVKKVKEK